MIHNGADGLGSSLDPDHIMQEQSMREDLEAAVTSIKLKDGGILHPEGYMIRRGTPAPTYGAFAPSPLLHDEHSGAAPHLAVGALKNEGLSASPLQEARVAGSHYGLPAL